MVKKPGRSLAALAQTTTTLFQICKNVKNQKKQSTAYLLL